MIKTEIVTINGKQYRRTWSDNGFMIEREGAQYGEAIDPLNSDTSYIETDIPIEEDILYRDGYRIIPDVITAGTAFALDELGWWGDKLYKSLLSANVYTPKQYPRGWELQE